MSSKPYSAKIDFLLFRHGRCVTSPVLMYCSPLVSG
jgi:hypothetical protein